MSWLRQNEEHEHNQSMVNHGSLCGRKNNGDEIILKLFMWKKQWVLKWCVSKVFQYT